MATTSHPVLASHGFHTSADEVRIQLLTLFFVHYQRCSMKFCLYFECCFNFRFQIEPESPNMQSSIRWLSALLICSSASEAVKDTLRQVLRG